MLRITLSGAKENAPCLPGLPSWMSGLLAARGIRTEEEARRFLNPALDQLLPPERLRDMDRAVSLILKAKEEKKSAVIYGDYDVDGVSASAILWEALGSLGLERQVYIPDRHREGYGLNCAAVEALARECKLLITVDCGITSVEEVKRAKELGMTVIVTDHHRHGDTLPPADAVISPLLGDYPFPYLCGAGVAWKLARALLGEKAEALLEIAAIATVADMVSLTGENRAITALGLEMLARTERPGLRALMSRAGIQGKVSSDQVAFQIAPRMNACGRMESAQTALKMLLTKNALEAEELALKMEGLNQERKRQENLVLEEALEQVKAMNLVDNKAIVTLGEGWNSGVVGLAAGRVAEKYAYPTVALAREGDMCVGSARSAGEIDIHRALSRCADLFERFGGHKQAAGLTLRYENVEAFRERLSQAVTEQTGGKPVIPSIPCDGELALGEVTEETVRWLARLEPFGIGNPAPRFLCGPVKALSLRAVGADQKHLKCTFQQGGDLRDGIFFGGGDWAGKTEGSFRMAMSPTLNEFRGKVSAECRLYALQAIPESLPPAPDREAEALFSDETADFRAPMISDAALEEKMSGGQGTLLVCRCRETALRMREKYPETDFCLDGANDPRAFHTVLLYGSTGNVTAPFRTVVLCDGDLGEGAAWKRSCPEAEVFALPQTDGMRALLSRSFADKNALRRCYASLRTLFPASLGSFAMQQGLEIGQALFALRVLQDIQLIEFTPRPFRVSILPMQKRDPEESIVYQYAKRAKEEGYGLHGV